MVRFGNDIDGVELEPGQSIKDQNGNEVLRITEDGAVVNSSEGSFDSADVEDLDITNRWDFEPGYDVEPQVLDSTSSYDSESHLVFTPDGDILNIYRQGSGHTGSDGTLVYRRSPDGGQSWSDPQTVVSSSDDDRNHVVFKNDDGEIHVIYRNVDDVKRVTSTDGGDTWSSPTTINPFTNARTPFGDPVKTSNGWMLTAYKGSAGGIVEVTFSTDGGYTWGNLTTVASTESDSTRELVEPWSVVAGGGGDNVVMLGRENEQSELFAVTSDDGGSTWTPLTYFDITRDASNKDKIAALYRTGANEITVFISDRDYGRIIRYVVPAADFHSNPPLLRGASFAVIANSFTRSKDFGYPSAVGVGAGSKYQLVSWYDDENEDGDPNIWLSTVPDSGVGAQEFGVYEGFEDSPGNWSDSITLPHTGTNSEGTMALVLARFESQAAGTHIHAEITMCSPNGDPDSSANVVDSVRGYLDTGVTTDYISALVPANYQFRIRNWGDTANYTVSDYRVRKWLAPHENAQQ